MITLNAKSKLPLYEQLYRALVAQIRSGELPAGSRLPGKRTLAAQLAVSVNTVDTAYQQLLAEGFLQSRPRSGFVVLDCADLLPGLPPPAPRPPEPPEPAPPPCRFDLSTGAMDTGLFPFRVWGRIQKELLYGSPELLSHGHPQGDADLRAAIAAHLRQYRGVDCAPEQIVVGAGVEYLLGQLARLLPGRTAAVENPGYGRSPLILQNNGIPCVPVDIDGSGLRPDGLEASGADLCYITPSHQFPTGVTMPAPRRVQLLRWARAKPGRYLLEDDYDSEFRFDIRPLPSLQGMAGPEGPVVYLSTFSKSLAPSIRIACMVLPRGLLAAYRQRYALYSCTVSRFEQQTLRRFLQEQHFARHLARMRLAYKARMEALAAALEQAFGPGRITLQGRHTGLHLLLTLQDGPGEAAMVQRAARAGVRLQGLSGYYSARREQCPPNTVVLGYAALPDSKIPQLVQTLLDCWG